MPWRSTTVRKTNLLRPVQILKGHQPAWHTRSLRCSFDICCIRDEQFYIHQSSLDAQESPHWVWKSLLVCFLGESISIIVVAFGCPQDSLSKFISHRGKEETTKVVFDFLSLGREPIRKNTVTTLALKLTPADELSTIFQTVLLSFPIPSFSKHRCFAMLCS